MIYRKRPYTPPPLRRVSGVEHRITATAPDGTTFSISWCIRDDEAELMRYPRSYMAERLRNMRRVLRERLVQYQSRVEV
jgi:hypothetical protein